MLFLLLEVYVGIRGFVLAFFFSKGMLPYHSSEIHLKKADDSHMRGCTWKHVLPTDTYKVYGGSLLSFHIHVCFSTNLYFSPHLIPPGSL